MLVYVCLFLYVCLCLLMYVMYVVVPKKTRTHADYSYNQEITTNDSETNSLPTNLLFEPEQTKIFSFSFISKETTTLKVKKQDG
jgi:hypothetical protein